MSERNINLAEIMHTKLNEHKAKGRVLNNTQWAIDAMKEAVKQALELATVNVSEIYKEMGYTNTGKKVEKAITNVINQVE